MNIITELVEGHKYYSSLMNEFEKDYAHLKNGDYYGLLRMKKALYTIKLDMEIHFAREEYALFSQIDHPVITTLIEEHVTLREKFRDIDISIIGMEREEFRKEIEKVDSLRLMIDNFRVLKGSHISKEENILFPYLKDNLTLGQLDIIQDKLDEFDNIVATNLI